MSQKGSLSNLHMVLQAVWNWLMLATTETGIQKKASSRPFVLYSDVNIIFPFRLPRQHDVIILMALICSFTPFDFTMCVHVHLTNSDEFMWFSGEREHLFDSPPVFSMPVASWEKDTGFQPCREHPGAQITSRRQCVEKKADSPLKRDV